MNIIGRDYEQKILAQKYASTQSEFIAVYGRRRVGKTFLVRNFFASKITLQITGIFNTDMNGQLDNFNRSIAEQFPRLKYNYAESWMDAFAVLKKIIQQSKQKKKVIFIDELPWFDTMHSGFVQALEHFWNSWASARKDVLLVVCGSATSWMINKLINNKGGLHNRITQRIKLEPFTLNECEAFTRAKKITLDRYQLLQLYMVFGGIPFYWNGFEKGKSAAQIIQQICFDKNGLLRSEFQNLYHALFSKAERHEAIVLALAKKSKGLTRHEIASLSKLGNGGSLTRLLNELEESGFIRKYTSFGKVNRDSLYQLCDFFSLFHLRFIAPQTDFSKNYWLKIIDSGAYRAWSGYAFEQVCLWHSEQIKKALGIVGIETEVYGWRSTKKLDGAQVDLVIDRNDGVVNLCEMKFSNGVFAIDKRYDSVLRNKASVFRDETGTRKSIHTVMITTYGIASNAYVGSIQQSILMDYLFENNSE